jgi:hypothetical protein
MERRLFSEQRNLNDSKYFSIMGKNCLLKRVMIVFHPFHVDWRFTNSFVDRFSWNNRLRCFCSNLQFQVSICHNATLVDRKQFGPTLSEDEVFGYLSTRKK